MQKSKSFVYILTPFTMTRVVHLTSVVATLMLVGCAGFGPDARPYDFSHDRDTLLGRAGQASEVTREYSATYEDVWNATVAVIQEMGHPIQTINKESGTLSTDWLPRPGAPFLMGMPYNYFQDRFSIRVLRTGDTAVRVGIRRTMQLRKEDEYLSKTSDGETEQWLLEQIAAKVSVTN